MIAFNETIDLLSVPVFLAYDDPYKVFDLLLNRPVSVPESLPALFLFCED